MILSGLFRCECGKLHSHGGINVGSLCTCGRNVRQQSINKTPAPRKAVKPKRETAIETARRCAAELAARQALTAKTDER